MHPNLLLFAMQLQEIEQQATITGMVSGYVNDMIETGRDDDDLLKGISI